jgi:hypothetical protein
MRKKDSDIYLAFVDTRGALPCDLQMLRNARPRQATESAKNLLPRIKGSSTVVIHAHVHHGAT